MVGCDKILEFSDVYENCCHIFSVFSDMLILFLSRMKWNRGSNRNRLKNFMKFTNFVTQETFILILHSVCRVKSVLPILGVSFESLSSNRSQAKYRIKFSKNQQPEKNWLVLRYFIGFSFLSRYSRIKASNLLEFFRI